METLEPILAQHDFLKDLKTEYIKLLVSCASNLRFDAGQYLFREGEDAKAFYIIRHGVINLEINDPKHGPRIIQTIQEGDVVGWSWLFPPYSWLFNARAATLVRAISLDGVCLRNKCEEDHDLGYEMMKRFAQIMADRLQATRLQILDTYA